MVRLLNFAENPNIGVDCERLPFRVIKYAKDLSVTPSTAAQAYFAAKMGVQQKQLFCVLDNSGVILQKGAMQWMSGAVQLTSGVKGISDLAGKFFQGAVTGESAIKPQYFGTGMIAAEPTYKHLLLEDLNDWGGQLVVDDGMFYACEASCRLSLQARSNFSSAVAGGEGLFNTLIQGSGVVCLESPVPREELIRVELNQDQLVIDGNFAVAWSASLQFSTEKSSKSLLGSAASGEGLVNTYRGTGTVLMAPLPMRQLPPIL